MKLPRKIKKGLKTLRFHNRLNKYERKALRLIEGKIRRQPYSKAFLDICKMMEMALLLRGKLLMEIPHDPNEQVEHIKMED